MAQQCPLCMGKKVILSPDQQRYELCPLCQGKGTLPDPGQFYEYELTAALTASGAANPSVNILNAPFKWMFAVYQSTGKFTVQIQDGSTQQTFSNQQVHVDNLFGTAQNPMPLLVPYQFQAKGQIQANVTDLSGAPNNIRLGFLGVNVSQ